MSASTPSLPQIALKLKALKREVEAFLSANPDGFFRQGRVVNFLSRYTSLVGDCRSALPALFGDIPDRTFEMMSDSSVYAYSVKDMLHEMEYCVEILSKIDLDEQGIALRVTREGAYFAGQQFDAIRQVQEIISTAQRDIVLIDGYTDEKTLDLITVKGKLAKAYLLTKSRSVNPAFRGAANAFNQQYSGLSVRTSEHYHDRFLFIDDTEFFHFGASLKDAGNRAFMFSRIEEPSVIASLQARWSQEWAAASIIL